MYNFVKTASNSLKPVILKDVKHDLWTEPNLKPLANFINHDFLDKDTYEGKDLTLNIRDCDERVGTLNYKIV